MRYFLHIGYHGAQYSGWQKHPGMLTVQQVMETAISKVLKTPVAIIGCGRTDAQVHASQFFFHMDIEGGLGFDPLFRLNKLLPPDIAIFDIIAMEGLPHARFDAIQRTYDYFIHTYKDPFLNRFSSMYLEKNLDVDKMKAAASLLPLYNDYRAFCTSPDKNEHTICNVTSAALFTDQTGNRLRFHISANRFLGKMIRIIVGRLLDIGTGVSSVDEFEGQLTNTKTANNIKPAYPQGLYLSKITYSYLNLPPHTTFISMLQHDVCWQEI